MSLVWLVTGGSRRFGRALAERVLAGGDQLVATTHDPAQLADLVERYGDRVRTVALDVMDEGAAREAVATALRAFGRLDVLFNNAGACDVGSLDDVDLADFFGVVNVTKAVVPLMCRQRAGRIIQLSASGGQRGASGGAFSSAARWGIEGFSEALAQAVELHGIKVTVIASEGPAAGVASASRTISDGRPPQDDLAKAAGVIIGIASLDEPPFRLELDVPIDDA
jgi:NAD(P)-dependent dehydrogenase (short-subunit alcohol dehydrogenase family)